MTSISGNKYFAIGFRFFYKAGGLLLILLTAAAVCGALIDPLVWSLGERALTGLLLAVIFSVAGHALLWTFKMGVEMMRS